MARLLSAIVGLPRDIEWRGKTVHTAVWKTPVQGRRMTRRLNVDGDGEGDLAGHGGEHRAVFVYQIESYRYWLRCLGALIREIRGPSRYFGRLGIGSPGCASPREL
jgi:MOSC domain-containing protein YiiM